MKFTMSWAGATVGYKSDEVELLHKARNDSAIRFTFHFPLFTFNFLLS